MNALIRRVADWARRQGVGSWILTPQELASETERQLLAARRTGAMLSQLTLSAAGEDSRHCVRRAEKILLRRLRDTDILGRDAQGHAVVLLPDTTSEGAQVLAADVLTQLGHRASQVMVDIADLRSPAGTTANVQATTSVHSDPLADRSLAEAY